MGITRDYAKFLDKEFGLRPVWPPTTPIVPGDYGDIEDGVFRKLGNVTEDFGISCPVMTKQTNFDIDCQSRDTRVTTFDKNGQVKALTDDLSGKATIRIDFKKEDSFFLRASDLKSNALKSINKLSWAIKERTSARQWNHIQWKVVSTVYEAPSVIILGSKSEEASIYFKGSAQALIKVFEGKVESGVQISGTSNTNLKVLGDAGPVLLRLFRVRVNGSPVLK